MKQNKHTLYIGANNRTGEVETDKIKDFLSGNVRGYTLIKASGIWEGKEEESLKVEIIGEDTLKVQALATQLCEILEQDAIFVTEEVINAKMVEVI